MRFAVGRPAAAVVLLFLLASLGTAVAQRSEKAPRVGYLTAGSHSDQGRQRRFEAFRQGLRELGLVNINGVTWCWARVRADHVID